MNNCNLVTVLQLQQLRMEDVKDNSMSSGSGGVQFSPRKLLPDKKEAEADQSLVLSNNSRNDFDEVDGLRGRANFGWLDITCIVVSISSYIAVSLLT